MSQTRSSEPSHDPLKASKLFALPEKPADLFVLLMRLGLLVYLVASVSLALHSAFSTRTRWFSFPERLSRNVSRFIETRPTNISHILFGLASAAHTCANAAVTANSDGNPTPPAITTVVVENYSCLI
uniref:Uncharacterized protein n=1 Tax=Fagus sylvatica TaxID=28930 RepID=A0A2N9IET2_FAGSY